MKRATVISALIVMLALPLTLSAAEQSLLDKFWHKVGSMFEVWEVALEFRGLEAALESYETDTGRSLSPRIGLETLVEEGYLDNSDIRDPWGKIYRYRVSLDGQGGFYFHLSSAGPDGVHGTDDDLGN